jgi:YbbR domain-containing protein
VSIRNWILDNVGLKLLSIGLAIILWAVVLGEQKVEVMVNIPFELNLPTNLVPVNEVPENLEVDLRGPKTLVTSLAPGEVAIPASAIRVPRGIEVLEVNPHRIRVVLEAVIEREVGVRPRLEGSLPDGFVLKGVVPTPSRITVDGPRSEVRRMASISTTPISLDGHTTSFTTKVGLESPRPRITIKEGASVSVLVEVMARRP